MIKVAIAGASGYVGGELIRLLLQHPEVALTQLVSQHHAGKAVAAVHPDLLGDCELQFTDKLVPEAIDLVFLALSHGEPKKWFDGIVLPDALRIIDLSQDFRDESAGFVYGLPEWQREKITQARYIANPGCFATAIQLALLPLAAADMLDTVYVTGITGSTGAGQSPSATTHFSWRANNIAAYKSLDHQHLLEINRNLRGIQPDWSGRLNFVPWRGDFTRGIFVSAQMESTRSLEQLKVLYTAFYAGHPFTHLSENPIDLKQVVNTNKCVIQLEKQGNQLVVHTAIDNLLKGAAGQAVQNMNLLFGLPENTGLQLKASAF